MASVTSIYTPREGTGKVIAMNVHRAGDDTEKLWFRSDRFFNVNSEWFFSTRENIDVGPFATRQQAIDGLQRFIKNVQDQSCSDAFAATIAANGQWAATFYH